MGARDRVIVGMWVREIVRSGRAWIFIGLNELKLI